MAILTIARGKTAVAPPSQVAKTVSETFGVSGSSSVNSTVISLTVLDISGSGSRLVNAGIPLQEGQLTDTDNAALWLNTGAGLTERSVYVASLAPHLDGSIRSLLVQWTGDPSTITAAELHLGTTYAVGRASSNTPPAQPVATLMPSSTHLIACDLFPFTVIPAASVHSDYSSYAQLFSSMMYWCISHDQDLGADYGKYARAMACFFWLVHNGPGVSNATTFFDIGCATALNLINAGPGQEPDGQVDTAGNSLHYLFTGYTGSRTLVGQFAAGYGGSSFYWGRGGRGIFHAAESMMYAYLLDIDDVSYGGNGPYTRAQRMTDIVARVTEWDAGWDSGEASLPTPVSGIWNAQGDNGGSTLTGPDAVLPYMVGMAHCAVMRCFKRLAGESSSLDNLRSAWETDMLNAADVIKNDMNGYDAANSNDCWVYACYMTQGTSNIVWTDGDSPGFGLDWQTGYTAGAGTNTTTVVSTGAFANVATGASMWNATRGSPPRNVRIITKSDDNTATMTAITGQTSGDAVYVRENDYASQAYPYSNIEMLFTGFVNTLFWYAKDATSGAQQIEFQNAARIGLLGNISSWSDPGTGNDWGNIRDGSYYVVNSSYIDQLGVNGGLQWLASQSEWMAEGVQS